MPRIFGPMRKIEDHYPPYSKHHPKIEFPLTLFGIILNLLFWGVIVYLFFFIDASQANNVPLILFVITFLYGIIFMNPIAWFVAWFLLMFAIMFYGWDDALEVFIHNLLPFLSLPYVRLICAGIGLIVLLLLYWVVIFLAIYLRSKIIDEMNN